MSTDDKLTMALYAQEQTEKRKRETVASQVWDIAQHNRLISELETDLRLAKRYLEQQQRGTHILQIGGIWFNALTDHLEQVLDVLRGPQKTPAAAAIVYCEHHEREEDGLCRNCGKP